MADGSSSKSPSRKKLFHNAALYSFFWSIFYFVKMIIFAFTASDQSLQSVDSVIVVQWEVVECLLAVLGVFVSLALFNSYKTIGTTSIGISWLLWMFSNFLISLSLLHQSLFLLIDNTSYTFGDRLNQVIDLVHIINAPATIYFILNFISLTCYDTHATNAMIRKKKKRSRRGKGRKTTEFRQMHTYEVHHINSPLAEEEVVYYV